MEKATLPAPGPDTPAPVVLPTTQAKPMIRLVSKMLKAKLPKLFRVGKSIESNSNIRVSHRRKKQQSNVRYW